MLQNTFSKIQGKGEILEAFPPMKYFLKKIKEACIFSKERQLKGTVIKINQLERKLL